MAAKKINLLPKELTVSKGVQQTAGKIKKIAYGCITLFVLVLAIGGGLYFYFSNELKQLEADSSRLKTNIQSLQETEQQLLVTKDRVEKIKTILGARTNEEIFAKHKSVVDNLPDSMTVVSSEVDASNSTISFEARDSRQLANFMSSLLARADSLSIIMDSLSFNPFRGYSVDLEIF